jgi:hypothetical protein
MPDKRSAEAFLKQWCAEVDASKIPAFMKFAKTVRSHWVGIIHFVETQITNGILEGINSKVQLAKRRARGYRNIDNFINMIYFLCGKLKFDYIASNNKVNSLPGRAQNLYCSHLTISRFNAWNDTMQKARMLKEIQMLPLSIHSIMDWTQCSQVIYKLLTRFKTKVNIQFALG